MTTRTRNWRQRWDPEAPLVFNKKLRMGNNPKKPFVMPGDKVTKKQREKMGLARLRMWFESGTLGLADWAAPSPQRDKAVQLAAAKKAVSLDELLRVNSAKLRADLEGKE